MVVVVGLAAYTGRPGEGAGKMRGSTQQGQLKHQFTALKISRRNIPDSTGEAEDDIPRGKEKKI